MSALQIGLIVVAVLAVAGLAVRNWWQERKYRQQWMATFGRQASYVDHGMKPGEDAEGEAESWSEPVLREAQTLQPVMLSEQASEPVDPSADFATPAGLHDRRIEPVVDVQSWPGQDELSPVGAEPPAVAVEASPVESMPRPVRNELPPAPIDALLEFGISMHLPEPVSGSAFGGLIEGQHADGKPVRWTGYAERGGKWVEISPWRNEAFSDAMVAVQLADRQGPVSEQSLRAVCEEIGRFAARHHGTASWEDVAAAVQRAARLDRFCVEVDVLIGLNVVSPDAQAFAGSAIAAAAEEAGMTLDATGVYQRRNERGDVLYTLCNHENVPFASGQMENLFTHGLTLFFEVPRIENGVAVFAEMARFGQSLATGLGGRLVDDNIRPLSASGLEKIQSQLVQIYQQMEAGEIPAGGRRAMRLFN